MSESTTENDAFDLDGDVQTDDTVEATEVADHGTTLDSDVTKPSVTVPGDGPADTTDPNEAASSVRPNKAAAAVDGHLTVNAVVKVGEYKPEPEPEPVYEFYPAVDPRGYTVWVKRDIKSGKTVLVDASEVPGQEG